MDIGKIMGSLPANLNLGVGVGKQKQASDRDPNQGGQSYGQNRDGRQPNEQEAQAALEVLSKFESVVKSELRVELIREDEKFMLAVKNAEGKTLRVLRGAEVLNLLEFNKDSSKTSQSGRILDRRV